MDKVYQSFELELETITPLHIGDGNLITSMDYIVHGDKIYVLSLEWIIKEFPHFVNIIPMRKFELLKNLSESSSWPITPGQVIQAVQRSLADSTEWTAVVDDPGFKSGRNTSTTSSSSYTRGRKHDHKASSKLPDIHTFVKSKGKAYIPGSSIKGALRTAIAFYLIKHQHKKLQVRDIENLFRDRTEDGDFDDVFKCVSVSDAMPVSEEDPVLHVVKSQRIGTRRHLINYWEVIPPKRKFTFTISIHTGKSFAGYWQRKTGLSSDPRDIIEDFMRACNLFSREIVQKERDDLNRVSSKISKINSDEQKNLWEKASAFYRKDLLLPQDQPETELALVSMARGTGKHRKSIQLAFDEPSMPITREVIHGQKYKETPLFGWVMLRLVG